MYRLTWSIALLGVLSTVLVAAVAAAPTDPPFPTRIDFPAPTVDPVTGAVTTNFSPEGMAISGNTFYAGSTATGEIIKGNLQTGAYQRNWVPASPAQPNDLHRGILGLLVDDHNRLWAASSVGMACTGTGASACPPGAPSPQVNYGAIFVYDATTGAELAQYTVTNLAGKLMNDMTIANNALFIANTTAPACNPPVPPATTATNTNCDTQFEIPLGPGGALPPGDTPPTGNTGASVPCGTKLCPAYANPVVIARPTPGFPSADGIDTLPNGNVLFTSVSGGSGNPSTCTATCGQIIQMDSHTGAWSVVAITTPNEPNRPATLPPLLSLDGVTLDGNMLYAPENRTDTATCPLPAPPGTPCPGDWAAIHLDPPSYTTGEVITRLNSPPGSGLPPLRSPANMEQLGHSVYGISRVIVPVTINNGTVVNTTQTFIERLDKVPLTATGVPVSAIEGASFSGQVAAVSDPNNGPTSGDYPQNGSSAYGYSATINWGDGSTSTGTVSGSDSHIAVAGTHTYAEPGSYPVTATVTDPPTGETLATTTSTATVAEGALTASGTAFSAIEGANASGAVATFTDADSGSAAGDYTATVNWGDGTPATPGTVSGSAGHFTVAGSHTYAEEGSHVVTTTVTDTDASPANTASATSTTSVGDAALTAAGTTLTGLEQVAISGVVANVQDANTGGSAADLAATINWGDGTAASPGTVSGSGGNYSVHGSHVYAHPGSYSVTTAIADDGGSSATATGTVNVATDLNSGKTTCRGLFGGSGDDVTVPSGATCTLLPGTHVGHDVKVEDGGTLIDQGAVIDHDLSADGAAGIQVAGGSIGHDLTINGVTGSGNYVRGATVGHDLVVRDSAGAVDISGNTVGHDLTVRDNSPGGVTVSNNSAGHDATCKDNSPQSGSGNSAGHSSSCPA